MEIVGLIGLGIMGLPIAEKLLAVAAHLLVNDVDADATASAQTLGATPSSRKEIAQKCEVVFLSLPSSRIVEDVLFGQDGIAEHLNPGALVCDLGTNRPEDACTVAVRLETRGVQYIDAPVSGGESKAKTGELSIMAGGGADCFRRLQPYFHAVGSLATHFGPVGSGCMAKAINQILVHVTQLAICEAFALAEKSGLDLDALYRAFRGGSAGSAMLDNRIGKFTSRDFRPGAKISIVHKDIDIVLGAARAAHMPLPLTAALGGFLEAGMARGMADLDVTAMITLYEWLGAVENAPPAAT
ncbi:MAG: NAD(P)-binding domain-containing protein [Planctomycetaceae bacterium]|nr:NAD(P)-binding domain-containing protein [Planctomycetaceae bacterium]